MSRGRAGSGLADVNRVDSWQEAGLVQIYTGGRIRLRPARESDAATSFAWRVDPAVRDAEIGCPFPTSLDAEVSWIRSSSSQSGAPYTIIFSVEELESRCLVGYACLHGIDWVSRTAELGLVVGPPEARGRGVGYEAAQLILKVAFATFGLSRVWLRVISGNVPARRLYEKCGFTYEGVLRRHVFSRGARRDVMVMGILAEEFERSEKGSSFWLDKKRADSC